MPRLLALTVAVAVCLAGCGRPFHAATPPGFVDFEDRYGETESRAASADGVVLGVRALPNEPKGQIDFWTKTIENRLRDAGHYDLLAKAKVTSRDRLEGVQLTFGHDEGNEPHVYVVALFVTDEKLYLLEAGGTKVEMDRVASQVDWSVKNFSAR